MVIKPDHKIFSILDTGALRSAANAILSKNNDALYMIELMAEGSKPWNSTIIDAMFNVNKAYWSKSLQYFIISESVIGLSDAIVPDKLIDKHGHWKNAIKAEYTGASIFRDKLMFFEVKKDSIGAIIMDQFNEKSDPHISAFSVETDNVQYWLANENDNVTLPLLKSILYMIFSEVKLVPIGAKHQRKYKDNDNQKHMNTTGVKFTVVDKTWAGKIAIGGHMRSGHFAVRYTGRRDNPVPKIVWIAATSVRPYVKNAKKDKL